MMWYDTLHSTISQENVLEVARKHGLIWATSLVERQ
jgi:hypothetical protein